MKTEVGELFEELSKLDQVEAIALGGSRATEKSDESIRSSMRCLILNG